MRNFSDDDGILRLAHPSDSTLARSLYHHGVAVPIAYCSAWTGEQFEVSADEYRRFQSILADPLTRANARDMPALRLSAEDSPSKPHTIKSPWTGREVAL